MLNRRVHAVVKAWNHQVAGGLKSIGVFGLRDHQVKPTIKKSSDPKGCGMPDTKKSAQKPQVRTLCYSDGTALVWYARFSLTRTGR